jgi:hypothetical protein
MPKTDGTGPDSKGSASGRGLGRCNKNTQEEFLEKAGKGLAKKRVAKESCDKSGSGKRTGQSKKRK